MKCIWRKMRNAAVEWHWKILPGDLASNQDRMRRFIQEAERIFWFAFSRDGKQLALSRGMQTSDVILINFKQKPCATIIRSSTNSN